jgi:hypothetical protein
MGVRLRCGQSPESVSSLSQMSPSLAFRLSLHIEEARDVLVALFTTTRKRLLVWLEPWCVGSCTCLPLGEVNNRIDTRDYLKGAGSHVNRKV